jgi:hypothetical protein
MTPITRPYVPDEKEVRAQIASLKAELKAHGEPIPEDVRFTMKIVAGAKPNGEKITDERQHVDVVATLAALEAHCAKARLKHRGEKISASVKVTTAAPVPAPTVAAAPAPGKPGPINPKPSDVPKPRPTAVKGEANLSLDERVALAKGRAVTPKNTLTADELIAARRNTTK